MHYYTGDKPVILRGHFLRQLCFRSQKTFCMTGPLENPSESFQKLSMKAHMPSLKEAPDLNQKKKTPRKKKSLAFWLSASCSSGWSKLRHHSTVQFANITCIKKDKNTCHGFSELLGHPH